ncbi:unnamed protein product [Effrenium voratum]|nr:unnamed protein product [Effrenium voratum]
MGLSHLKRSASLGRLGLRKYLGVRSAQHFVLCHAELRKSCGRFDVAEGPRSAPVWAKPVIEAVSPEFTPGKKAYEQPMRIMFGVGAPSRSSLSPRMDRFRESRVSGREANAILQSAFPAAYEWLQKRWLGPDAVTGGAVLRRKLPQDKRRQELELEARRMRSDGAADR